MRVQAQVKGQAFGQAGGQLFVLAGAFIQRDQADLRRQHAVQPIALQQHLPAVQYAAKTRRRTGAHALGHGQQQHATVGLRQEALQSHLAARLQRGAQVQAAEQGGIAGVQGHAPHRAVCG